LATGFETGVDAGLAAGLEGLESEGLESEGLELEGLEACVEAGLCAGFATGFDCARFACFSFSNCCFNTASCSKPIAHDQASKTPILAACRSLRSAGPGGRPILRQLLHVSTGGNRPKTALRRR